jgi:hypothetical protein
VLTQQLLEPVTESAQDNNKCTEIINCSICKIIILIIDENAAANIAALLLLLLQ